ncbi:MAG: hypothetical protein JNJ88_06205 [Planctomycetes bacterium]|nr:hypothetical protein [Planctomycetota bacterium]
MRVLRQLLHRNPAARGRVDRRWLAAAAILLAAAALFWGFGSLALVPDSPTSAAAPDAAERRRAQVGPAPAGTAASPGARRTSETGGSQESADPRDETTFRLDLRILDLDGRSLQERDAADVATPFSRLRVLVTAPAESTPESVARWAWLCPQSVDNRWRLRPPRGNADASVDVPFPPPWTVHALFGTYLLGSIRVERAGAFEMQSSLRGPWQSATLRFVVLDGDRALPLPGALVTSYSSQERIENPTEAPEGTSEDEFDPGILQCIARFAGASAAVANVQLGPGDSRTLQMQLHRGAPIRGRLLDGAGQPAAGGVQIRLNDPYSIAGGRALLESSEAGADGYFSLQGVRNADILILALAGDGALCGLRFPSGLVPGDEPLLVLREGFQVELSPERAGWRPCCISIRDSSGSVLWSQLAEESTPLQLRLAQGTYSLEQIDWGGVFRTEPFRVENADITLSIRPR